jgi:hypothetical protein
MPGREGHGRGTTPSREGLASNTKGDRMTMFDPPAKVPGRLIRFWWDDDTESWGIAIDGTGQHSVDLDDHDPARGVFVRPTNPDLIANYVTALAAEGVTRAVVVRRLVERVTHAAMKEAAVSALLASAGLDPTNGCMNEACTSFVGDWSFCGTCG